MKHAILACAPAYALLAPLLFAVDLQPGGVPSTGVVGVAYTGAFRANKGSEPYTFSLAAGSLPNGLSMSPAGNITGTPTLAGIFIFTVRVTDQDRDTDTRTFIITIAHALVPPLAVTTTSPLPAGTVGSAYSQSLSASGGSPPYLWSGSAPAGLSLAATGSITGTPNAVGNFSFTATVTDSASRTASRNFAITINPPPLTITTASPLPNGGAGTSYSQPLSGSGGVPPYRWSGTAPAGLTLSNTGVISGIPTTAGAFNFTVTLTDNASATVSRNFSITIEPPALTITSGTLPSGSVGVAYSQQLSATGGSPPLAWSVTGGQLPGGLALNSSGVISGTPSTAGAFNFTVQARDNAGTVASKLLSISIEPAALTITSGALASGSVGVPYSQQLSATGGSPPLAWSVSGGQLPGGLALNSSSGVISGTPTIAESVDFTVQARDASNRVVSKQFSISIEQGLTIFTASPLPGGTAGAPYSLTVQGVGGSPPYSWIISAGSLPEGITLNTGSGQLSGVPGVAGTASFTLQARDSRGASASKQFTLLIGRTLAITTASTLPEASPGAAYNVSLSADGGTPPYVWSIASGAPPPGLEIGSASGVVAGIIAGAGEFTFAAQVIDSAGASSSRQFLIIVREPIVQPSLTVGAVPEVAAAAQQLTVDLNLTSAAPSPITGQVSMRFVPDAAIGTDDPAVQFSTGGRSASFTIPANATRPASPIALQTGSLAGVIELQFNAPAAGVTAMTRTIRVARSAPAIGNFRVVRNATGFELRLVGLSTSRELTSAVVRFAGSGLDTTELRVSLADLARAWYQSDTSARFGSQFALTLPFTVQGASNTIRSATLTVSNTEGDSQPLTAEFPGP